MHPYQTALLLKAHEVAYLISDRTKTHVGEELVRKLIRRGDLPTRHIGRHLLVPRYAVEKYIAGLLADPDEHPQRVDEPLRVPTFESPKAR